MPAIGQDRRIIGSNKRHTREVRSKHILRSSTAGPTSTKACIDIRTASRIVVLKEPAEEPVTLPISADISIARRDAASVRKYCRAEK